MSFITSGQLKTRVANALKVDENDLPGNWDQTIEDAATDAYREIVGKLMARGFTQAQIDAWDRGAEFQRDIGLFWNLVLQAWFWMTPVVYTIRNPDFEELLYLNPVARCLYLIRWFMVYHYLPSFRFVAITVVACAGFFLFALRVFRQNEPRIPEEL